VYTRSHRIEGESLYPACSVKNGKLRIDNFYPESDDVWEAVNLSKQTNVTEVKKVQGKCIKIKAFESKNLFSV